MTGEETGTDTREREPGRDELDSLAGLAAGERDRAAGRALTLVVDDQGGGDDPGALVGELLIEEGFVVDAVVRVPADEAQIRSALNTAVIGGVDLVVTVGGTGVGPRDVTPEVTAEIIDRPIPGIDEALRSSAMAAGALDGGLSRGVAGMSGSTLVVNLADGRAAVRDGMATLGRLARHVIGRLSDLED